MLLVGFIVGDGGKGRGLRSRSGDEARAGVQKSGCVVYDAPREFCFKVLRVEDAEQGGGFVPSAADVFDGYAGGDGGAFPKGGGVVAGEGVPVAEVEVLEEAPREVLRGGVAGLAGMAG